MSKIPAPELPQERFREDRLPEKPKAVASKPPEESAKLLARLLEKKAKNVANLPKPESPRPAEEYDVAKANVAKRLALIRRIESPA